MNRRTFLAGSLAAASAAYLWLKGRSPSQPQGPWEQEAYRIKPTSNVAILTAKDYDRPLTETLLSGIKLFQLNVQGKTVVLKPNLVEYDPAGVINTHPTVIAAAIDAFRTLGAREVIVAEGPGHRRDNEYLLTASGLHDVLKEYKARYVDLDYDEVSLMKLKSRYTPFGQLYLPETVLKANLFVSMPKMKTHHWAGVTLNLKNMFGIVPGVVYGWPKNLLHQAGIDQSILDINSTLTMPRFSIVDGIIGMEGNGPIEGKAKPAGVLVLGEDPVAVDATVARLMKIDPRKVPHLAEAGKFMGNVEWEKIHHIGEPLDTYQQDFSVLPMFQHLKG